MMRAAAMPLRWRRWLSAAALALGLLGCDDLDNFDVEVKDQVVLQGGGLLEGLLGEFPQLDGFTRLDFAQSAEFEERGYSPDDVDYIRLSSLIVRVLDPEGQDLAFIGEMRVILDNPNLPALTLATQTDFPAGEGEVAFETSDSNLKTYLLGTRSSITFEIEDSRRPPQDTQVEIHAVFDVDINVI
ncbi:MAG: hypothetical protein ACI9U2_002136 [Bradymonadia bacterium]|jgi:hypothetical protein